MDNEESILINPDTIERPRRQRATQQPANDEGGKFYARGGKVTVNFESNGRFGCPSTMYFKDYSVEHVNSLVTSNLENLQESLISIMEEIKNEDSKVLIADLTTEDFLEALIGIKMQFNTTKHLHHWLCECQIASMNKDKKFCEAEIDLTTIQFRSIEQADKDIQSYYKEIFADWTDEQFKDYLVNRYKDDPIDIPSWSREKEVESIQIHEPFNYIDPDTGDIYTFKIMRVGDLVEASQISKKDFSSRVREIKSRPLPLGTTLQELNSQKEEELDEIRQKQGASAILISEALTLIKFNGEDIVSADQKIELYKRLTRGNKFDYADFLSHIQFGVYDEREFTCTLCGKVSKRLLQQECSPIEFLPLDSATQRECRKRQRGIVFIGI